MIVWNSDHIDVVGKWCFSSVSCSNNTQPTLWITTLPRHFVLQEYEQSFSLWFSNITVWNVTVAAEEELLASTVNFSNEYFSNVCYLSLTFVCTCTHMHAHISVLIYKPRVRIWSQCIKKTPGEREEKHVAWKPSIKHLEVAVVVTLTYMRCYCHLALNY